jgi:peptide/nickel transport system substrate-binding protein
MSAGMRHRRVVGAVALGASVALTAAACGSSSKTASKTATTAPTSTTLHLSFLQDPGQPPDPDVYYAGQGLILTTNIYEGLLTYKLGQGKPEFAPDLATAWTESADHKTYTLTLRQGVTFHDGTPFTSAAVKPSFDRRAAVNGGPAYMVSDIKSVTPEGDYKVVITLKDSNTSFLDYLASAYGPKMMSPTGLAANKGKDNDQTYLQTHDLGTGAYTLTDAKVGVHYAMAAYPKWWGPKVHFTTIDLPVIDDLSTVQLKLEQGQLDAVVQGLNAPAVKKYLTDTSLAHYSLPTFETEEVYVNPNGPFFSSKANRNAFQEALDIPSLVSSVFQGRASVPTDTYPQNMLPVGSSPQTIAFDPTKLQAAAAAAPASSKTLTFSYDTSQPDDQQVANILGAKMQAYGLNVKVQGAPTATTFGWVSDLKGAPDVFFAGLWPDAANPYTLANIEWGKTGGLNYLHCSDPSIDAQLPQALETGSQSLYEQIGEEAIGTGCWTNIANRNDFVVAQKWLKGVEGAHDVAAPDTLVLSQLSA